MSLQAIEQREDGRRSYVDKRSAYRKWLKKAMIRRERHRAKANPACVPQYGCYRGYEY